MHCVRLNTAVLTHTCIELSRCFTYNASQSSPSPSTSPPSPSRLAREVLRSSSSSSLSPLPPPSSHSPAHPDDQDWPPGWREVSRCPNDLQQRLVARQCAPSKEDYHDSQSVLLFWWHFLIWAWCLVWLFWSLEQLKRPGTDESLSDVAPTPRSKNDLTMISRFNNQKQSKRRQSPPNWYSLAVSLKQGFGRFIGINWPLFHYFTLRGDNVP